MFSLTKQEKTVLLVLAGVCLLGSILHYLFQKDPRIRDWVGFLENERLNSAKTGRD